jgi:predicted permease
MSGSGRSSTIKVRGYTPQPGEDLDVGDILVGPNYTETLGVPLIQGREIGLRDTPASQKIAVVNEAFVERFFKNQNPIGHSLSMDDETEEQLEIVGVVGDLKFSNTREKAEATVYRPILQEQNESAYSVNVQIRTTSNPSGLAPAVRQAINQIDAKLPIFSVTTLSEQVEGTLKQDRLIAQLVSFFGALALILAAIGLYGVMSQGVARRTNEIGIRMALGAEQSHIAWMVLRETLFLVISGLVIGVPTALLAARLISNQLFGLGASDPLTLIGAALGLTVVALLAGYIPARRATKVNPLVALRYE